MPFFGKKSGFKNMRDLAFFLLGVGGIIPQIVSIYQGNPVNLGALMFFGSIAGAPFLMRADEK